MNWAVVSRAVEVGGMYFLSVVRDLMCSRLHVGGVQGKRPDIFIQNTLLPIVVCERVRSLRINAH